ncbi:hypothetical protein LOK49_LG15G02105 [Camellia lanceoleosa]|uniref:Uncharacterized protein n=1 Tax=Camellia lanceoleosa TaxID=1840588 RepID=A0ACC0F6N5_9ERIC|nr:hypothetical protein LOK49_LG15G02105 [Camellia lanceoleosa]
MKLSSVGGMARVCRYNTLLKKFYEISLHASEPVEAPLLVLSYKVLSLLKIEGNLSRNDLLGELKVTGIPRAPCGVVSIKLDFCVDKKGFLTVLAKSKDTNFEWSMETNYLDKLCENYVWMMAKKAILSGKMNVEKNALMQLKSVVEFKINRIEKMLNFWKKQIPREYLRKYELDLAGIKKAMDLEDMLFLKSMLVKLNNWRNV